LKEGSVSVRTDPEGNETRALFELAGFHGADVLEIGAGDGRLTWRYAHRAASVTAVEPFEASVARAEERVVEEGSSVEFVHAGFEDFAADCAPDRFDVALLSWSLC
jgi:2-polyprenyl-3-methyl-5-hydroxy-6-metoxy-1,4-benzoquinol methylase